MTFPDLPDPQRAWAYLPASPLSGAAEGPLVGLTFSVKDLYGVPGWPLRASTRAPVPDPGESMLVRRLLDLGASAVGKTHLHEVALGITGMNGFGGTTHPFDPERVPGGSSSGAAVSVALWQVDFALGTDTGGSIRVPAAWCGVVGYKPTKGHPAWSTEGVLPLSWTCDHAGPLARDMRTIVQVQEALTGQTVAPQDWAGVKVGLWLPEGWVDDTVREALRLYAARLAGLGATVEAVPFPEVLDAYSPIVLSEAAQVHSEALKETEPGFLPFTHASLRQGQALTEEEVRAAFAHRAGYRAQLDDLLSRFDVLLAPAVPTPPPLVGQEEVEVGEGRLPLRRAVLRLTAPFSLLGAPTVALPSTAPFVGVQLVGRHGEDDRLLGLALALEG
ncbi:amidase [Deinococcus metallilatus]|uniref:Amidase n=1 Tax=Deinococcus metallilatus TaxID=1211322 RepID=A0AAJ5F3H3_9DEIO|nr:amidase [Deinococcus metallilatus]MBB5296464.1 amidase/aspartyl-tRNA(Asn)/glutamyl-tRNA(Gln) amidotransferase subunit A [Deinococcus metallilatus]QBY08502.1 amidase [Deinococcus metallilatus]RXJ11301.1 amidase [Deinococcus metallilatus]TLK24792.1 amidase [Deinococcus metallilatus]GMA17381.1 amidase [Deinococcus metallilatus]